MYGPPHETEEEMQRRWLAYQPYDDSPPEACDYGHGWLFAEEDPDGNNGGFTDTTGRCLYCGWQETPEWGKRFAAENMSGGHPAGHAFIQTEEDSDDDEWRAGLETGEPMDIAWRLLKEVAV